MNDVALFVMYSALIVCIVLSVIIAVLARENADLRSLLNEKEARKRVTTATLKALGYRETCECWHDDAAHANSVEGCMAPNCWCRKFKRKVFCP